MDYSISINCGHNSNVCLFTENQIIEVIAEEKFSNIKDDNSFPKQSIEYLKKKYNIDITEYLINSGDGLKLKRKLLSLLEKIDYPYMS